MLLVQVKEQVKYEVRAVIALYGQGVSRYIIINEYPPMTRLALLMFLFKVPRQCSVQYKYDS